MVDGSIPSRPTIPQRHPASRAFELLNLGRYERQAYLNVGGWLSAAQREQALLRKETEFREMILRTYRGEPLANDGFFHGKQGGRLMVIGPINLPVGWLFVEEVITECRKRGATAWTCWPSSSRGDCSRRCWKKPSPRAST